MEGTSPSSCVFSVGDEKEIGEESTEGVASVKGWWWMSMAGIFMGGRFLLGFLLIHSFRSKLFLRKDSLLFAGGSASRYSSCFLSENGPYFKRQGALPGTLAAAKRRRFMSRFLSEPVEKCSLAGAGGKSWFGSVNGR